MTTPQACLDQWVDNFNVTPRDCFLDSEEHVMRQMDQIDSVYKLYYGGCGEMSVEVWFEKTMAQWESIAISTSAHKISDADGMKRFNLMTGMADRVGFRVPKDQVADFDFAG